MFTDEFTKKIADSLTMGKLGNRIANGIMYYVVGYTIITVITEPFIKLYEVIKHVAQWLLS